MPVNTTSCIVSHARAQSACARGCVFDHALCCSVSTCETLISCTTTTDLQVAGKLSISPGLEYLEMQLGQLHITATGSFHIGSEADPHTGGVHVQLNSTLVDTDTYDQRASIDVHGSMSIVSADVSTADGVPVETTAGSLELRFSAGAKASAAQGQEIGVFSSAGSETGTVGSSSDTAFTLTKALQLQHEGDVTAVTLSRRVRFTSVGDAAVWRVWNGDADVSDIVQLQPHRALMASSSTHARPVLATPVHAGIAMRKLLGSKRTAATSAQRGPRCAGGPCGRLFTSSLALAAAEGSGEFVLQGVEVAGFGTPDSAAIAFIDHACVTRWPRHPKAVKVLGSAIHGVSGAGVAVHGCLAGLQARSLIH